MLNLETSGKKTGNIICRRILLVQLMAHMCEFAYQPKNQILFIRRKDVTTHNIMSACSLNMQFMFVWAG
jgi:hypothetical protein